MEKIKMKFFSTDNKWVPWSGLYGVEYNIEEIAKLPKDEAMAIYKSIIDAHFSFVHIIRIK